MYQPDESEVIETQEWYDSLDAVLQQAGAGRVTSLMQKLEQHVHESGVKIPFSANTPYVNTIPVEEQPPFPGDGAIERRIRSIIRWNAMAMVVRANRVENGIGGHISTYASAATLLETGFNHFFRAPNPGANFDGDLIFFQGHASPGIYARAFLEGRLTETQLENFRREMAPGGGLSSYPHPWLMPTFWQLPTVSMGLSPIMAIYLAKFRRYLENRGLKTADGSKVWAFLGDGEVDEPETLGAITLASREKLDNLIFVINCNLQRLDGPVRGNGKIIQELEAAFRGAGWNVIKVIWGDQWDPLLQQDASGKLVERMGEVVDGQYQKYIVSDGDYIRKHFFGVDPDLEALAAQLSDKQLMRLNRGGHDTRKVYAAYKAAIEHTGQPTVILAKTVKGYGLGEAGEGRNITHQQKKLNEDELRAFRKRFDIPLSDDEVAKAPFYKPADDSEEIQYLRKRREALGGYLPARVDAKLTLPLPPDELFTEFHAGSKGRRVATTMAFVRLLHKLLADKTIGPRVVPIVPDECRTFGMEALFREYGIYSSAGQLYEPVDAKSLMYYREAKDGQLLEEGITEAGAMSSFIAAGTSYATMRFPMLPFFIYYSMFGFQRIGDLVWAAADMRCRGFMLGATAGRTTLAGEGLQHQDGHSHLLAYPAPNLLAFDPAFAFELAVIIRDGMRRMYVEHEDILYYLTVHNEPYEMPAMPEGVEDGILKGLYKFRTSPLKPAKAKAQLLGSGSIMMEALKAAELLETKYGVAADVWSVTSYKALHRDILDAERWNYLHPDQPLRKAYITQCLAGTDGVCVAASDNVKALPESVARFAGRPWLSLGTDGFGRSEGRNALRDFFEVDARYIAVAALNLLAREGAIATHIPEQAIKELEINPEKANPVVS